MELLLKHGASINFPTEKGQTALHFAAASGSLDIVDLFMQTEEIEINAQTNDGRTALYIASNLSQNEDDNFYGIALALLENGASANIADRRNGFTPLHLAAYKGHEVLTGSLFIDVSLDATQATFRGKTAYEIAVKNGHSHIVRVLAENGVE